MIPYFITGIFSGIGIIYSMAYIVDLVNRWAVDFVLSGVQL